MLITPIPIHRPLLKSRPILPISHPRHLPDGKTDTETRCRSSVGSLYLRCRFASWRDPTTTVKGLYYGSGYTQPLLRYTATVLQFHLAFDSNLGYAIHNNVQRRQKCNIRGNNILPLALYHYMMKRSTQNRRSFTGKERDVETGYGFFDARYMNHELMTSVGFFNVFCMSENYYLHYNNQ